MSLMTFYSISFSYDIYKINAFSYFSNFSFFSSFLELSQNRLEDSNVIRPLYHLRMALFSASSNHFSFPD